MLLPASSSRKGRPPHFIMVGTKIDVTPAPNCCFLKVRSGFSPRPDEGAPYRTVANPSSLSVPLGTLMRLARQSGTTVDGLFFRGKKFKCSRGRKEKAVETQSIGVERPEGRLFHSEIRLPQTGTCCRNLPPLVMTRRAPSCVSRSRRRSFHRRLTIGVKNEGAPCCSAPASQGRG